MRLLARHGHQFAGMFLQDTANQNQGEAQYLAYIMLSTYASRIKDIMLQPPPPPSPPHESVLTKIR